MDINLNNFVFMFRCGFIILTLISRFYTASVINLNSKEF